MQEGFPSALSVPLRKGLPTAFLWTFFLTLFLLSGILPKQSSITARMLSGSTGLLSSSVGPRPASPVLGLSDPLSRTSEPALTGAWGLAASLTETSFPDLDYSDLFCLHTDSGPGPVLECHHDDPPLSAPGIPPSFLAAVVSSPRLPRVPTPNLTGHGQKVSSPTLSTPTLPPRGLFV